MLEFVHPWLMARSGYNFGKWATNRSGFSCSDRGKAEENQSNSSSSSSSSSFREFQTFWVRNNFTENAVYR